jgi:hypothetical protein
MIMVGRACIWTFALICIAALSNCGPSTRPEKTVRTFVQAINDRDLNLLLTCIDPRQERMFRGGFRIIERFTNLPLQDILEMIPGLSQLFITDNFQQLNFSNVRVVRRSVHQDTAIITVSAQVSSGSAIAENTIDFVMQRFELSWRIMSIRAAVPAM